MHGIDACATIQEIVARITRQGICCRACNDVFNPNQGIGSTAASSKACCQINRNCRRDCTVIGSIHTIATIEDVVASTAYQGIVTRQSRQVLVSGPGRQEVIELITNSCKCSATGIA